MNTIPHCTRVAHRAALPALALLEAALLILAAPVAAQRAAGTARAWEHESSDLPVDPRIHFGTLDNGLRFAWATNSEPKERSYLRLHVDVGSFAETEAERGMAHFLEHMAFNGSRNFPADTLVEWFQEHGMAFGADLNAFTSFSQTVYQLDLAHSDGKALEEGLAVLRDWADGLLLAAEEIDKEKGVIDGEETAGDSAERRVQERLFAIQYGGTLFATRDPIGVKSARDAFAPATVRAFYTRWYRPENMTLMVIGDLGELDPEPLIHAAFGELAAPASAVDAEPDRGDAAVEPRVFAVFEPELPSVSIHIEKLIRHLDEPDNARTRTDDVDLACARQLLNLRLRELAKKPGTPFLSARADAAGGLEVYDGESLVITAEPEKWREALVAADQELRRALEFGFQDAELAEVRANWLRALDEAVERERTRSSASLVAELVVAAEDRHVPTAAAADRALMKPVIDALTVEQCHQAFGEAWSEGVLNLFSIGNLDLGDDEAAATALTAAHAAARNTAVTKGADVASDAFAYASDPATTGEITSSEHVEDLDVRLFTFANGVRLNVKATDFKEREILVSARLAEGLLTVEPADFGLAWAGSQAFNLAGLAAHTQDDLRRLTAGKDVGVGFGLTNDAFSLGGATTGDDLLLQLEILTAYLTDPGWRDDGVRMLHDRAPLIFERLRHVASGPLLFDFLPALFHGDPRFTELPTRAALDAVTIDAIRTWLAPQLARGPLEVTIVGDLDVDAVLAAAARTLGTLLERRDRETFADRRKVPPPATGLRMTRTIDTSDAKSFVYLAFPTDDGIDTRRRRELGFLGEIVQDRVRLEVRERLGAAYSPQATSTPNPVFPGIGLISIQSAVDPDKVETFTTACLAVAQQLADDGVTAEEVARLAEPVLAQIRDAKRTNGFWVQLLAEAQSRPTALGDIRTLDADYQALEPARFDALAKLYLPAERASILVVNPATAATRDAAADKDK